MPPIPTPDSYPGVPGVAIHAGRPTPPQFAVQNIMRVSGVSGTQENYPLQFGRPFRPGEIAGFPQVVINGAPVLTQADVKTRHADGSVKFAVISIVVPSLPTSETVLTFVNQSSPPSTPETIANMLANYDFEAAIDVRAGGSSVNGAPASARAMLAAASDGVLASNAASFGPNSRYWTQGPICTTVILCDHTAKAYDLGVTAEKTMRPVFYVEFWPTIGKYKVRHVLEIADVTKLRGDAGLQVVFSTGHAAPVERLNQSEVNMAATTWQSREYWGGDQIAQANVQHGMEYLSDTGVIPNFDTSITLLEAPLTDYANDYATLDKSLGAAGQWQKYMPNTGGRPDLTLFTKWELLALWSGRAHMIDRTVKHSEFAGSWPMYWREGAPSRTYFGSTDAQGREVTLYSRPTQYKPSLDSPTYVSVADRFTYFPDAGNDDGWIEDYAHFPSLFYVPYLMTGGAFWYEKMQQISCWGMFALQAAVGYNSLSRGHSVTNMMIDNTQVRAWAWQYRNRARAWWAAVDGSPTQALMQKAMDDATAARCGIHDVDEFVGNTVRDTFNTNQATFFGASTVGRPNGMGFWTANDGYTVTTVGGAWPSDSKQTTASSWMQNFVVYSLAHAVDLGYSKALKLRDFAAQSVLKMAVSTKPRVIAANAIPIGKTDNTYYQTPAELFATWAAADSITLTWMPESSASGFPGAGTPNTRGVTVFQYGNTAAHAIACCNGNPMQAGAWAFVQPYHQNTYYYNHDPREAVIPRSAT
jgi:hypothetical protein